MFKDTIILLGGFLTALLALFTTLNISFEWFTKESIDSFVIALTAFVAFAVNVYAVWKNTHVKDKLKANKQKREL
jgi:SPP1 phage holin